MGILSALLSLLGSSAVGSVIGGVFAFLNRKTDIEAKRMELEHDFKRWQHEAMLRDKDLALAQAEAQGRREVAVIEADGASEVSRLAAIARAHEADRVDAADVAAAGKLGWMLVLVTVFNKLIRPVATILIAGAACYLNWLLVDALVQQWPTLPNKDRLELAAQALAWIGGQGGAVLGYWFVSRGSSGGGQIK